MPFGKSTTSQRVTVIVDEKTFFDGILEEIKGERESVVVPSDSGWMERKLSGRVLISIRAIADQEEHAA
jgi:hypothetical protein